MEGRLNPEEEETDEGKKEVRVFVKGESPFKTRSSVVHYEVVVSMAVLLY